MLCFIYKSLKRDQTYLYINKKDDFSAVPELLMQQFGTPQLALIVPLDGSKPLINADIVRVKDELNEKGFFLQLPPPQENWLKEHLAIQKQAKIVS